MKLKTAKGFIEVREIVQYNIMYNGYMARHDMAIAGRRDGVLSAPSPEHLANQPDEEKMQWLRQVREDAAPLLVELLGDNDASEAQAEPIPAGVTNPAWVKLAMDKAK